MSFCGRVSTGLIQATPGEMKSFKSSAERIALIVADVALQDPATGITPLWIQFVRGFFA